jgi:hypothetical protein
MTRQQKQAREKRQQKQAREKRCNCSPMGSPPNTANHKVPPNTLLVIKRKNTLLLGVGAGVRKQRTDEMNESDPLTYAATTSVVHQELRVRMVYMHI